MQSIAKLIADLTDRGVQLVAVSKTQPVSALEPLYALGQRDFGENRVQEMLDKRPQLPADVRWHLIGHLQTNKVKFIAPFVHLIHSVDSLRLLEEIDKQAAKNQRIIPCLLQFHVAQEESKFGLDEQEAIELLESPSFAAMRHVDIRGIMGMASFSDDAQLVRAEFRRLKQLFDLLKSRYFSEKADFREISMGMSGDYTLAIEEGSTMVRIGSLLFQHG
jgi:PLP dependent protein